MPIGEDNGVSKKTAGSIKKRLKGIKRAFYSKLGKFQISIPAAGLLLLFVAVILTTGVLRQPNKDVYHPLTTEVEKSADTKYKTEQPSTAKFNAERSAGVTQSKPSSTTAGGVEFETTNDYK